MGTGAERRRAESLPPRPRLRGVAAAAGDRPDRPLPDPRLRRRHAARRDAAGARPPGARRARCSRSASATSRPGRSPGRWGSPRRTDWRSSSAPRCITAWSAATSSTRSSRSACAKNLAILPWSPLAGGFLTGKYRRDQEEHPEGSRFATSKFGEFPPVDKERGFDVVERLIALAVERDTTPDDDRDQVAADPARRDLGDHRRPPPRTARRQPRRDDPRPAAGRPRRPDRADGPAHALPQWMIERQAANRTV